MSFHNSGLPSEISKHSQEQTELNFRWKTAGEKNDPEGQEDLDDITRTFLSKRKTGNKESADDKTKRTRTMKLLSKDIQKIVGPIAAHTLASYNIPA